MHLPNGVSFEIRHPDQAVVSGSTVLIALPLAGAEANGGGNAEVSLVHITHLETIPVSQAPSSN
jgi:hypothetical protein